MPARAWPGARARAGDRSRWHARARPARPATRSGRRGRRRPRPRRRRASPAAACRRSSSTLLSTRKFWPRSRSGEMPNSRSRASETCVVSSPNRRSALRSIWLASAAGSTPRSRASDLERRRHICRLVGAAAVRRRGQVGAVCLGQDALGRHAGGGGAERAGGRIGDVACKRAVVVALDRLVQAVDRAEAVQDNRHPRPLEHPEGVVVGRARMDHERHRKLVGKLDLGLEHPRLDVMRGVVAVVVEPALADRHRPWVRKQRAQRIDIAGRRRPPGGGIRRWPTPSRTAPRAPAPARGRP